MKRKVLWCWLSLLLVAALVLASCGPKEGVVKKEGPQYGGTLTLWKESASTVDPPNPDMAVGNFGPTVWLSPVQEKPLVGDIDKYGPRGTGEFAFQLRAFIPEKFLKGQVLESWEVNPDKTVWHIRPGIMWHGDKPHVMNSRELTAEDVVADLIYFRDGAAGGGFRKMSGDIYATDRYTLVIETPKLDITLMYYVGYEDRAGISPPEVVAAGADKWENYVGSGPFMLKEYVVGSHMTYVRNPDYWDTTTIDGVEYSLPFIDKMTWPIIPDESTQMAALRTGMIDFFIPVPPYYWPNLEESAPELLSAKYSGVAGYTVGFKCTQPPFDDANVRRAMMIGTDTKVFADLQKVGELPLHWYPMYSGNPTVYTPLEELPAETQLLYDYNPDLAKKMLADAGYPDGFEMELSTLNRPMYIDQASLIKDMWAKIGVDVEIISCEGIAFEEVRHEKTYTDAFTGGEAEQGNPVNALVRKGETGHYFNFCEFSDERLDALLDKIKVEADITERDRLCKEAAVLFLNEVPYLPLTTLAKGHFWWPWIKNYYGESNVQDADDLTHFLARIWIDENLKREMGY